MIAEGKIIDPKFRSIYARDIAQDALNCGMLPPNGELVSRFIRDARLGRTIRNRAKKRVGQMRLNKYLYDLRKLDRHFQKPLDIVTTAEMEAFITALEDGRFTQRNGKPYTEESQVGIKHVLIKFYKWLGKPKLVEWIDTSYRMKLPEIVTRNEIDRMLPLVISNTAANTVRNRALLLFLFDSGARLDETTNVRLRDLRKDDGAASLSVSIRYSKTKPRTITLPLSTEALEQWLALHPRKGDAEAQLFPMTHHAVNQVLGRIGQYVGIHLHAHKLRRGSASYWGSRLTEFQVKYRLGWSMSSSQASRYIDPESQNGKNRIEEVVEVEQSHKLANENRQLQERLAMLEEQMRRLLAQDVAEVRRIIAEEEEKKVPAKTI